MRPASFVTTVGPAAGVRNGRDIVVVHEPDIGATLRTRGRFYLLCEVDPPTRSWLEIAADVTEAARHDYYYDLSAGVEVGLRRALRKANRRAAQLLRDRRERVQLHLACAVVVNNEMAAARIGGAYVFLVRHARLFFPGEEPDELADFVHRTTTRQAASLGAEADLLPQVWRQTIEAGDTIVLASWSIVDGLGADALKNAAVMLHPRAAAQHIKDRAVAEGVTGSAATVFIEVAAAPGGAARRGGEPEVPTSEPPEVVIAETIRSRADHVWRLRPRLDRAAMWVLHPVARAAAAAVRVALELMPRHQPELPRRPQSARRRSLRTQRATSLLGIALLLLVAGIGYGVVRDYQAAQVRNDYHLAVVRVQTDIDAAKTFGADNQEEQAWTRLTEASDRLSVAARSPAADTPTIERLREEISAQQDTLNNVIVDLATARPVAPVGEPAARNAAPGALVRTVNGLYAVDGGSGRLWRIWGKQVTKGDTLETGVVLERGKGGVATPTAVAADGAVLLVLDDERHLWRAEGDKTEEVKLPKTDTWKEASGLATFADNVYVLDPASGQVWRYAPDFTGALEGPLGFLPKPLPADSARGVAVDGDVWVLTSAGEIQRYRRVGLDPVLTRIPFSVTWKGTALAPTAIQAVPSQSSIWILDAKARTIAQLGRDGREIARFSVSAHLPPPTAFYASESQDIAYTVHGSKIAATDLTR